MLSETAPDSPVAGEPELVIHILYHGRAICPLEGIPNTWPEGHKWVTAGCADQANCPPCKEAVHQVPAHAR